MSFYIKKKKTTVYRLNLFKTEKAVLAHIVDDVGFFIFMEEQNTLRKPLFSFSSIPNSVILDCNLSAKAKGIFVYFLSRPDGWKFYASEIVKHFADGKDSIRSGIKELCDKEYLRVIRVKNEQGQFIGWLYEILLAADGGKTENGFSDFGKPDTNKIDDKNKTDDNKKENIKKKESSEPSPESKGNTIESMPKAKELSEVETQAIEIYKLYPRKAARPDAIRAIKKALKAVGYTYLYTRTQKYAEAVKESQKEPLYIPYPATWFNREEYNDDWSGLKSPKPQHQGRFRQNDRSRYDAYGQPYEQHYDRTPYINPDDPDDVPF